MIFDYELMFIDDKEGTQKDISSGVLGEAINLSGANQGRGKPGLIAIAFNSDTTATTDPEIQFALETADNEDFDDSTTFPLLLAMPLKKEDLAAGTVLSSPLPLHGLKQFVRLKIGADAPITCMGIKAGFVLDATIN